MKVNCNELFIRLSDYYKNAYTDNCCGYKWFRGKGEEQDRRYYETYSDRYNLLDLVMDNKLFVINAVGPYLASIK